MKRLGILDNQITVEREVITTHRPPPTPREQQNIDQERGCLAGLNQLPQVTVHSLVCLTYKDGKV